MESMENKLDIGLDRLVVFLFSPQNTKMYMSQQAVKMERQ